MTWVLVYDGGIRARGTYAEVLDTAGEFRVLQRAFHFDGTEFAPRLERGWMIIPEAMVPARGRRAAA